MSSQEFTTTVTIFRYKYLVRCTEQGIELIHKRTGYVMRRMTWVQWACLEMIAGNAKLPPSKGVKNER